MQVVEAHVRRAVRWGGIPCGEVEVTTDEAGAPVVLAFFSLSKDNDFDLQAIVRNDADTETDWFDNNMHQAFQDMTVDVFQNVNMKTDWGARESFKEQVLSSGKVREELKRLLEKAD
ncbi:hypothetical protein L1N85_02680 [Paenibacillus alkaliterrae]|uniref:hypothetical protein n=1 Tax=Paenibacillus alkaliterrae TaxID=320909 RepID=UPI001F34A430|nr:hypothetical protein [Paenibacillus alkaliterrae]MCF2937332.1 hypothetical protein [Paenibacillus alkaliterrae]